MALPRTSTRSASVWSAKSRRGFTLLEIVVVVGIFTLLAGITLIFGLDGFRGYTFRTERDILVAALQRARAEAMGNVCLGTACTDGRPHGVSVQSGSFVIFQGSRYALRDVSVDELLEVSPAVSYTGSVTEIVFEQLRGRASSPAAVTPPWTIILTDSTGRTSAITISSEGRVSWTH